ncbi:MAG: XTP/dITP diphosphatase [Lachnospiraceae bacterium]|nr:XTP/dITP diphosphatase [Lachnospiraceae bacterium]
MSNRIVFATGNENKMREIRQILSDLGMEIVSMKQAGVDPDIVEDGTTFMENAVIKAKAVAALLPDDFVLADDSGLVVDALGGEPGVYSARYMGENTSYDIKNKAIIDRLEGVPKEKRTARFVCAIAAVTPSGKVLEAEGKIEGYIGYEQAGENGFGYDPIFYLYENDLSTAQIPPEEKNSISHRGNALRAIRGELEREIKAL